MKTATEVFIASCGEEFLYVWDAKQEKWFVGSYYTSTPNWTDLDLAVKAFKDGKSDAIIFDEDYTVYGMAA